MSLTTTEEALVRELLAQQAAILSLAENEATIQSKLGATKVTLSDLTAASSLGDTDLLLVRQGTTDKSVLGSIIKALATLADNSVTQAKMADNSVGTAEIIDANVTDAKIAGMSATKLTGDVAAARITSALNATGSAPMFSCRAWVNFNGQGTIAIRGSGNVSSLTDEGVGAYAVNMITAMPDANYNVVVGGSFYPNPQTAQSNNCFAGTVNTVSFRLSTQNSANTKHDAELIYAAVFR